MSVLPSFLMDHYDQMDTYALVNATLAKAREKWPVVRFIPGYGAARAFYTSLAVGLASQGYVVLSLDHPSLSWRTVNWPPPLKTFNRMLLTDLGL